MAIVDVMVIVIDCNFLILRDLDFSEGRRDRGEKLNQAEGS